MIHIHTYIYIIHIMKPRTRAYRRRRNAARAKREKRMKPIRWPSVRERRARRPLPTMVDQRVLVMRAVCCVLCCGWVKGGG